MNKKINIILLSLAGGIAALGYIIKNVKSGETGAIIFTVAILTLMAYKPSRVIIVQLLAALVNLFSKLAENADATSNQGSERSHDYSKPTQPHWKNAPTVKHYYCKLCGIGFQKKSELTINHCRMNNHGRGLHQIYQGSEKPRYECANCPASASNLSDLVINHCRNADNGRGYHVPIEDWT